MYWPLIGGFIGVVLVTLLIGWIIDVSSRDNAERQALNAPIQGTAADILKIAMNRIAADLAERDLRSRMLLQVHDELVFEVAPGEQEELTTIVRDRMGSAARLRVPLEVQVGVGPDWDAAAH